MKFVKLAAAAIAVSATTATAGGMADTVVEPILVEPMMEPTSSLGGLIVPAILLALIAIAATAESDSDS
ncbi:hypothetical protein [Cognatiyoonia sp.]|uniref:hypothetical protein n=1 Tax=Cognatiyoonia sp. TaxID=2211652 RepID=UPI003F696852